MSTYLDIVGSGTTHVTLPTLAAYTDDILDIRVRARATWATAGGYNLGGVYGTGGNQAWAVYIAALGKMYVRASDDGTNLDIQISTTPITSIADNEDIWLKWIWNAGAISYFFSRDATFDDTAVSWTAHGTDTAGFSTIYGSTLDMKLARLDGVGSFTGRIERFIVRTGAGAVVVADIDFTNLPLDTTSFTEDSSNAATVTLNDTASIGGVYVPPSRTFHLLGVG